MELVGSRLLLVAALILLSVSVPGETDSFPDWLEGGPDTAVRSERCEVYQWFFSMADDQTEGVASQQSLARRRVMNIANKLVDHHQQAREEEYSGRVKYLVFGEKRPFHFEFRITASELDNLLSETCSD